jgi:enediyne polyketide synthase
MKPALAIVGMACRYPDAATPAQLWENALAGRRAFRRIPPERLRLEDYLSSDRNASDSTYSSEAALIEGYEFDRVRFRVAGSVFRSADFGHWLALDVAAQALADAGFPEAKNLPKDATGVVLGNTLTGEFSRANGMRLRWPYVRRVLESALISEGWTQERRREFLQTLEAEYKKPFPPIGEESLAGGLSNTIAGRICNHFDLKGGGYTVDGACASSLLAIITACSALATGDLDVALAGGVDLSLDPFELVGFAKTGALASDDMRVFDTRSAGFWPGEGCGFVVLMRHEDAIAQGRTPYAVIQGWGVSSDGSGGITRPEVEGQLLALQRAYRRAGFDIGTVPLFEGHGTGTTVGDETELRALSRARRLSASASAPAVIGSIKANIGHTKAAAGVAGLIKAAMALHTQILPAATGCKNPHPEISGDAPALRALSKSEPWPEDQPLRAGVSAMGFGGINTHVVLERIASERRKTFDSRERALTSSAQDAELFLLGAANAAELIHQIERLLAIAPRLSRAEMIDLSATLESSLGSRKIRASVVASTPAELTTALEKLKAWALQGTETRFDIQAGIFLSNRASAARIGFLFPGQGSPSHATGGALRRRFEFAQELYDWAELPVTGDSRATEIAQPAIITATLAAIGVLRQFGIEADAAVGHSLGELAALHWAGAYDEKTLLRIACGRGKAMAELNGHTGSMASIRASLKEVEASLNGEPVVIAGVNSPRQTVISGEKRAVESALVRLRDKGLNGVSLPVSHAFHSPLVSKAAPVLSELLDRQEFYPLRRPVFSTVTGATLEPGCDLRNLLSRQITSPVMFADAIAQAEREVDFFIEAGPGQALSGLASEFIDKPVIAIDAGGDSLRGLLKAIGAAFAFGIPIKRSELFAGRFARPFDLDWQPQFFKNPCEMAPIPETEFAAIENGQPPSLIFVSEQKTDDQESEESIDSSQEPVAPSALEIVRQLVARRAELPDSIVRDGDRLLSDLHLNSITVSQLVTEAARRLGLRRPVSPTDYADASVADVAEALEELKSIGGTADVEEETAFPIGVDSWIRAFTIETIRKLSPSRQLSLIPGSCKVIAPADHPIADSFRRALESWEAGGAIIVCLPAEPDERHIDLLLEGARAVLQEPEPTRFVLIQHGGSAAAFAKSLHLETPGLTTCVIDIPLLPAAVEWAIEEIKTARGYTEARFDSSGNRSEPFLKLLEAEDEIGSLPLGPSDVLLVTGGGKGITAECALSLGKETGASLILMGLSQPDADQELSTNLERMNAAGIRFEYVAADITDAAAVESAVSQAERALGKVTGIIHGAAVNIPQLLKVIDRDLFAQTLATKLQGARNALAAVDKSRLKVFVTFSSIIARTGLPGESHYGLANEWMTRLTEQTQQECPECRCLAIEWSVWSGAGMAQRIGGIERLAQAGITPIPVDEGVSILRRLLARPLPSVSVVVSGRYGELPTLKAEEAELPLMRFLEKPRVYFPGVELIADSQLSLDTDPYIADHVFEGEHLLPAVMGLEAMAQVSMALTGSSEPPAFENVKFARPIVVPVDRPVTIRLAALASAPDRIEVVLRSAETAFQQNHFSAVCVFNKQVSQIEKRSALLAGGELELAKLPLEPTRDLYGTILFHKGRFRRLLNYRLLKAKECLAEIAMNDDQDWFGPYLPSSLVLGDAAARDALIHAVQACIPHATLLPIGVDRIVAQARSEASRHLEHEFVAARERTREGNVFTYYLEALSADGEVIERWDGLRLQIASSKPHAGNWAEPLLGAYVERRINEMIPGPEVSIAIESDKAAERRERSDRAIHRAVGDAAPVLRSFDGRPEASQGRAVSASHCSHLTFAAASSRVLACDVEQVTARSTDVWRELLGIERFRLAEMIANKDGGDLDSAATRVWSASECLKKAGAAIDCPLTLELSTSDGWVMLSSGSLNAATYVAMVRDVEAPLTIAVLIRRDDASI